MQPASQSLIKLLKRRHCLTFGGLFLLGGILANCGAIAPVPSSTTLTISAAASLQNLLRAIAPLFKQQFPDISLSFNFGSSGALRRQIAQGAQVDVFLSASLVHMDALEKASLIVVESRRSLFANQIALVTAAHVRQVQTFQDLVGDSVGTVAIGQPESVPVGAYAKEVLASLDLYPVIQSKLVYGKDARQVLTYVATGNVDAALVYRSDVPADGGADGPVTLIAVAQEGWHSPIVYPGAAIADSPNQAAANQFLGFLQGAIAQKQIVDQGFQLVPIR